MTRKRLGLLGMALLAALLVVTLILSHGKTTDKTIAISGITQCSKDVDPSIIESLNSDMYSFVQLANNHNKLATPLSYQASTRDGTCKQISSRETQDFSGKDITIFTSRVIVDIPEAKQSWEIRYDWVEQGEASQVDLGSLTPQCLTANELRYGDFKCQEVLSIEQYGTADYDPILKYMPYSGEGFNLDYSPANRQVLVTILVPATQQDNQALIDNNKAIIPYWFDRRKLDINKYTLVYRVMAR